MKQNNLEQYLLDAFEIHSSRSEKSSFIKKVKEGKFLKSENPNSHFCVMFVPFDSKIKRILLVHHKKANSWIFPGGHIEKGEFPSDAALREAKEELGLQKKRLKLGSLFAIQRLDIDNPPQICSEHFDIFYTLPVFERDVKVNPKEFLGHEWLKAEEAKKRITSKYYKKALNIFIDFIGW